MLNSLEPKIEQSKLVLVVSAEGPTSEVPIELLRTEGYGIITALDGFVASSLFQSFSHSKASFPFNLLILAWVAPRIEELELCRLLRQQGNDVPILMLSISRSELDRVLALEAGADDCLSVPFNPLELIVRCQILLRRPRSSVLSERAKLQFDDVCLYPEEHRVLVRGREVKLSPTEFRLLELFVRSPRRIWSREQLYEQVWGNERATGSKTVEVHIRWLREKIELRPARPRYIVTVPRLGYRLG